MARFHREMLDERFRIESSNPPMAFRRVFICIFTEVDGCCKVSTSTWTSPLLECGVLVLRG
jgi:hypothetical protein